MVHVVLGLSYYTDINTGKVVSVIVKRQLPAKFPCEIVLIATGVLASDHSVKHNRHLQLLHNVLRASFEPPQFNFHPAP